MPGSTRIQLTLTAREGLERLHEQLKEEAPKLESFSDVYPPEEIAHDRAKIASFHAKIDTSDQGLFSRAMEAGILEAGNAWLPGVISKASEFDDLFRKTDLVWEVAGEGGEVATIALDVFAGKHGEAKLDALIDDASYVTEIKYLAAELSEERGRAIVPRVLLGIADNAALQVFVEHIARLISPNMDVRRAARQELVSSSLGASFRRIVAMQLRAIERALAPSAENDERVRKVLRSAHIAREALEAKEKTLVAESGKRQEPEPWATDFVSGLTTSVDR